MNPWDADAQVQAPSMPWDDDLASHVNPQQRAVVTANDNADEAAKAITVGKKLNVSPTVVQSDLPGYEAHQRTQSAVSAVQNEFIAKYIGNNPMASQVSSDDYEKLDEVSQYLQNLKEDKIQGTSWLKAVQNIPEIGGMLASGPGRQKLLDAAMELPGTLLKGIVDWAAVPGKVLSGEVQLGTKEGLNEALGFGLGAALGMKSAGAKVEGGVSVRPTPDEIRTATAEHASESLTKAVEVAQESKTKIRSPETFAEFTNAHEGGSVFVPAETIADLYQKEGKAPAEGDGLFGFVPDIARRVELARETGAEVEIPMGDYIAHIDPTVHEGLKDSVRLHESGVTVEEAKEPLTPTEEIKPKSEGTADVAEVETKKVKQSLYLNQLFKDAKSIGLTEPEFKKYSDKIERAEEAILDKAVGLAAREAKKRIEPAWRENEMRVRAEVEAEFNRTGPYAAEKFIKDEKINLENVADDIAPSFGFETGQALTDALKTLEGERLATGKGPAWQLKNAVKEETARRMEERFGNLNEIISDEAWENALAEHTFDILADEIRILADKAGIKPPVGRQELTQWVKDQFQTAKVGELKSTEWLRRAVEKGGREAEKGLLAGKFDEAFQAKQKQMLAAITLKEAQKFEGVKRIAERQFDRVTNEEAIASVDREYLEQARGMLEAVGVEQKFGVGTGLPEFVAQSEGQLAVASWLTDGSRPPNMDNLSVAQYRELSDSIKSMIHVGRQAKTLESAQGKALIDNVMFDLKEELSRFDLIHDPANANFWQKVKHRPGGMLRAVGAQLTLAETVLDYTDKYNPKGPLTTYLDRPLRDSNSTELKLKEMVVSRLRDLRKYTDSSVNDRIANDLIPDSRDRSGFYAMDRGNLRQLILNMGNRSNIKKLAEGYNVNEADLRRFIWSNAKEADYRWAQGVWDIFAKLRPLEEDLALRDSGVALDTIEASPLPTPHGDFRGGYFPVIYDANRSNIKGDIRAKDDGLFDKFYRNVMPAHGYTESRTGYKGFVDLTGDLLPSKLQTAIHDISFREAIRQANKIINHPDFHEMMGQKWGNAIANMFPKWIRDIANVHSFDDDTLVGFTRVAAGIRQNIVSTLIALNPGTYIKHGGTALAMSAERVGVSGLAKSVSDLGFTSAVNAAKDLLVRAERPSSDFASAFKEVTLPDERGEATRQFILDSSPVMRNRQARFEDSIRGAYELASEDSVLQDVKNIRHWSMDIGRAPVAFSDAVSALPTWLTAYKKALAEGTDHADAVFQADKEVSRAHGSNFIGDKPNIMRTNSELQKWMVPLYNFWNHMFNRQLTMAWDMTSLGKEPNANIPSITRRLFWLTAIPIIVEEMAGPARDEEGHSLGVQMLMAIGRQYGSMVPGLREITNGVLNGYEPSVGLLGFAAKEINKNRENILKTIQGKKTSDALIHSFNALGALTGIGGSQLGKTTSFLTDLATGKEQPRSFDEWRQGLRTGHSKVRRH